MKFVSSLLLFVVALSFASCNTPVTRRDLYSPKKGGGYWTKRYVKQRDTEGLMEVSYSGSNRHVNSQTGIFGISHPSQPAAR